MKLPDKSEIRDLLLTVTWALISVFLVKATHFEVDSANFLENVGGIALFTAFVIAFEILGKQFVWRVVGKHHRLKRQILSLLIILVMLAGLFAMVA